MTRVVLVRHATHGLVGKTLAGRMPGVALSDEGREQATGLAAHFAGVAAGSILSSPLERTLETASPIAERLGRQVEVSDALNEIDCGEWTGLDFDRLADDRRWRAWNSDRGLAVVPGGESITTEVEVRGRGLFEMLAGGERQATILVTHSDVIKVAILSLLEAPLDSHDRLEMAPASITTVDLWSGGGKVVNTNQTVTA